jgi:hypothetical protein
LINNTQVSISSGTKVTSSDVSDFTTTAFAANDNLIASLTAVGGVTTYALIELYCQI